MRDETKKLFDAPWETEFYENGDFFVKDNMSRTLCQTDTQENMNRISHIPELYEALIDTNLDFCQKCFHESRWSTESAPSADAFIEHGCPKIDRSSIIGCRRDHFWKLLKQVRDGK